jgi:alanine dehydrogenase
MLHYPTHPLRLNMLKAKGINAISLDSIVDDFGVRLVENMRSVAWNGLEAAFSQFVGSDPNLIRKDGNPWQVLIIGTGMVAQQAVDAASKLGNRKLNTEHMRLGGKGVVATSVGRNVTYQQDQMEELFARTDILVDASQRDDPSIPIIPNGWIASLPQHALIVDLSVDPYTLDSDPPIVKGIEGIPHGNLDQYIFEINDPAWEATVPDSISSINRRKVISCYSWPGIHPVASMQHYGQQLIPLMRVFLEKKYHTITPEGPYFERALYRAKLDTFLSGYQP